MKVIIFLDVDGVIDPRILRGGSNYGDELEFVVDSRIAESIQRISKAADIVWLTAWPYDQVASLGAQMGVESRIISLGSQNIYHSNTAIKSNEISSWLNRRWVMERLYWDAIVWVDDELGPKEANWAEFQIQPTLLVPIRPKSGLAIKHVQNILEFCAGFK
ncbi:hypothetical protein AS189_09360 [Arthrobacter alpinus]|uniref:Uncharacterized protein n=1 Tax=Arthrobacter alpinus TaxID=656366 RepID=A0A0S2LYS7_9MICC|nr:HAD domain-containing protein [Arthrobacter alpinus]ALO66661.1 hypothetical protein AS189_09360 [Arthrobacter alpinus]